MKYILGASGTGKTTFCFEEIKKQASENLDNTYYLIVPEQFGIETERNLIKQINNNVLMNIQVTSFSRFAETMFLKLGYSNLKILEDDGKYMLLRKIVAENKNLLEYFANSIDKQGYIDNLTDIITEFYNYLIKPSDIQMLMQKAKEENKQNLYSKLKDLLIIYNAYTNYLKDEFISTDEKLDILSSYLNNNEILKNYSFWIDSFTSFTAQEYKVIEKLIINSKDVTVSFVLNINQIHFETIKLFDPYYEVKNAIKKINTLALENNIKILDKVYLDKNYRHQNDSALSHLQKYYFNYTLNKYDSQTNNIRIFRATNIYNEIEETAKIIHALVSSNKYRYKDIALITENVVNYEKLLRDTFNDYEIPCFFDTKQDIMSHPLTELIRALIDIVVHNYSYESVFRFLKTNLTPIDRTDIDMLENYVLAYGIKNYKWHLEKWKYGFDKGVYDETKIHQTKQMFLDITTPITDSLSKDKKTSIKDICTKIFDMLYAMKIPEKLNSWIDEQQNIDTLAQVWHKQIWGKIVNVFEKLVDILGDEQVTISEFAKILDVGFSKVDMGIIPQTVDSIIVGDFERTKLNEVKAVFIINLNEGIIPKHIEEKGLLSDDERMFFEQKGMELKPSSIRLSFASQFSIYSVLVKPTTFLHLSYSLGTLKGKALQVSNVLTKIKGIFPTIDEKSDDAKNEIYNINLPKPTFKSMSQILQQYKSTNNINPIYIDAYTWFKNSDIYKDKINKFENILFDKFEDEKLNEHSIKKLYGDNMLTSVSKIERYVKCPFSYFVEYNLNVKERKIYEVTNLDLGNLFHKVLEDFSVKCQEAGKSFRTITQEEINDIVDLRTDVLAKELYSEVFLSTSRLKYAVERIKRISKRSIWALSEHVKAGLFEPLGEEIAFSFDTPLTSIVIELPNNLKITIVGRIDRVDVFSHNGNKYIKIIDYKSGDLKFSLSDVFLGMQMQLLLYLNAFIKNGKKLFDKDFEGKLLPGGIFYFNIKDPLLELDEEVSNDIVEKLILKQFKMSGIVSENIEIVKAMDQNISGHSEIIPAYIKKTDGNFGANSSTATDEKFEELESFVNEKIKQIAKEIFGGLIKVNPYKKGTKTGCDYCKYSSICQFDIIDKPNRYKILKD